MVTGHIPFELKFGRHLWKGDLTINMELPKLEDFLERLLRKQQKKSMELTKEAIKKQFEKKRRNPQRLKEGDNM